jgi:hypothetical protein
LKVSPTSKSVSSFSRREEVRPRGGVAFAGGDGDAQHVLHAVGDHAFRLQREGPGLEQGPRRVRVAEPRDERNQVAGALDVPLGQRADPVGARRPIGEARVIGTGGMGGRRGRGNLRERRLLDLLSALMRPP